MDEDKRLAVRSVVQQLQEETWKGAPGHRPERTLEDGSRVIAFRLASTIHWYVYDPTGLPTASGTEDNLP